MCGKLAKWLSADIEEAGGGAAPPVAHGSASEGEGASGDSDAERSTASSVDDSDVNSSSDSAAGSASGGEGDVDPDGAAHGALQDIIPLIFQRRILLTF